MKQIFDFLKRDFFHVDLIICEYIHICIKLCKKNPKLLRKNPDLKIIFLISQPNHMLWVLKRIETVQI